ncbi:MarR family transcriptional regulator [Glaciihabitans sp. dw_435]|uniref:MarR family winged helix-turn-helix transcriptional regulator n=1 Tax=Glaciihabitans sp. dw_435 TaxID=2720081 RepID=UPI001BD61399|nr:MarR family transcriptional regulator [Glaciihabitans sp. dw_435]
MARPHKDQLATSTSVDLTPVIERDLLDIRVSLSTLVHWADSQEVRREVMAAIDFPVDELSMFLVVNQLTLRGAMRPRDLATVLGTGQANMTKIAHRLQDHNLIVRVPSPSDDRGILLALTAEGRAMGERIVAFSSSKLEATLAHWSAKDRDALNLTLARLARDMAAPGFH